MIFCRLSNAPSVLSCVGVRSGGEGGGWPALGEG